MENYLKTHPPSWKGVFGSFVGFRYREAGSKEAKHSVFYFFLTYIAVKTPP